MENYTVTDFMMEPGLDGIIKGLNELTNGWFIGLFLLTLFFIIISMNYNTTKNLSSGLVSSNFIVFILSTLFWALDWVELWVVVIPLVLLVGTIFMILITGK